MGKEPPPKEEPEDEIEIRLVARMTGTPTTTALHSQQLNNQETERLLGKKPPLTEKK